MDTECFSKQIEFQGLGRRKVVSDFSAGEVSSDAGGLLLRSVDRSRGLLQAFSECFTDHRSQPDIEHTVLELVSQRVYGIALGYEDLNDHETLRKDPFLATLVGKIDPTGRYRKREQDKGSPLAGKSTLNRLELNPRDIEKEFDRYKKISCRPYLVESFFVDSFIRSYKTLPKEIVIDVDATDDPLHGSQEGSFFHGYYGNYCYLPLYIFCGDHLLAAKLRTSDRDGADGTKEELIRIIAQIRAARSDVRIIIRGDSGFCRDDLMDWCEQNGVDFIFGLARNKRLVRRVRKALKKAKKNFVTKRGDTRKYVDFRYQTRKSWTRTRRVVGKAEQLSKGENPRFIVTTLSKKEYKAKALYEELYCARGDMENRIKEQQLGLFADRTSTHELKANQLRLWFSSVAYVLISELRRKGLQGTELAKAQVSTIRLKLLKIGALVTVSVRRVYVQMSSSYPYQPLFRSAFKNLQLNFST